MLERSGIARRRLTVDVAPEVLPLLLRDGYSQVFGARPLKRTVERLVLQPLARAIAAGQVPGGALLRLVANGQRIDIEVSPPETGESLDMVLPPRASPVAGGPGAYALLAAETGLHQVARGREEMRDGKRRAAEREVVHVEVLPAPLGQGAPRAEELRVEVEALDNSRGRLLQRLKHEVRLFHGPSMTSVRAWMDGTRAEAIERLRPLLLARLEAARQHGGEKASRPAVVRRYTLGPTTLVRDLRSGRTTGRLDQVLQGQLDAFL